MVPRLDIHYFMYAYTPDHVRTNHAVCFKGREFKSQFNLWVYPLSQASIL